MMMMMMMMMMIIQYRDVTTAKPVHVVTCRLLKFMFSGHSMPYVILTFSDVYDEESTHVVLTVARQSPVVTHDSGDVLRENLLTRHDVRHDVSHRHHHHQQQQHVVYSRRQRHKQEDKRQSDSDGTVVVIGIESLSDVLLTRIFYSGLRSDDLCRCAVVCRRWNRLVWNPLLWTCIDLSHAPDCDADDALRYMSNSTASFVVIYKTSLSCG